MNIYDYGICVKSLDDKLFTWPPEKLFTQEELINIYSLSFYNNSLWLFTLKFIRHFGDEDDKFIPDIVFPIGLDIKLYYGRRLQSKNINLLEEFDYLMARINDAINKRISTLEEYRKRLPLNKE